MVEGQVACGKLYTVRESEFKQCNSNSNSSSLRSQQQHKQQSMQMMRLNSIKLELKHVNHRDSWLLLSFPAFCFFVIIYRTDDSDGVVQTCTLLFGRTRKLQPRELGIGLPHFCSTSMKIRRAVTARQGPGWCRFGCEDGQIGPSSRDDPLRPRSRDLTLFRNFNRASIYCPTCLSQICGQKWLGQKIVCPLFSYSKYYAGCYYLFSFA